MRKLSIVECHLNTCHNAVVFRGRIIGSLTSVYGQMCMFFFHSLLAPATAIILNNNNMFDKIRSYIFVVFAFYWSVGLLKQ